MDQLHKESKTSLIAKYNELSQTKAQTELTLQRAINIANYFGDVLSTIEKLTDVPHIKQGVFRKFLWVVKNYKLLILLIDSIVDAISKWREEVNKLATPAPEATLASNTNEPAV